MPNWDALIEANENALNDVEKVKRVLLGNIAVYKELKESEKPIEPPKPEIEAPIINDILVSEDRKLVTVLWEADGPVSVTTSDGIKTQPGSDKESPLNIAVGTELARGFTVVNGAFEGAIIVTLSNDGGSTTGQHFIASTKPTTPEIPTKPVEPTPSAKPLSGFKNYQKGQVKAHGNVKVLGKINGVRRAAHPSLRNTQEGLIVLDDASKVFRIADLIADPKSAKPVGQFNTGGGADKVEFSPFDTGYYFLKDGVLFYNKLGEQPEQVVNFGSNVISGPSELGLISDDGFFGGAIKGNGYYDVFAYDVVNRKYIGEPIRVKLNDSTADYIGTFGKRSIVLKNVKQGGDNWKYKYDFFYIGDNALEQDKADKEGMYHAAGTIYEDVDTLADINKRWNTDKTFEVAQPLIQGLGGHTGRVDGFNGTVSMTCNQTGNMIITDPLGGIYCGNGVGKNDCYSVAFEFNGKLYAVVTKAIGDVELREVG